MRRKKQINWTTEAQGAERANQNIYWVEQGSARAFYTLVHFLGLQTNNNIKSSHSANKTESLESDFF